MEFLPNPTKTKNKANGFKCPLHIYQVLSWFFTIFNFTAAVSISLPQYKGSSNIIVLVVFTVLFSVHISLGIKVTCSDPTDPVVLAYHSISDVR